MNINRDKVYNRIVEKFDKWIFTRGKKCGVKKVYSKELSIKDIPLEYRTPGVCSGFMAYNKCDFKDVPESSKTRDFFITSFGNSGVNDYIKQNIDSFDKSFFKDLIVSNEFSTKFERNCFEVMPIEYIDDEMCSLAIISSLNWSDSDWFFSVCRRKPDAISEDVWKLAARLYANYGKIEKFVETTPKEYKDVEYYSELCKCGYNYVFRLNPGGKENVMDYIPDEVKTNEFLFSLLDDNLDNISRFNEEALERVVNDDNEKLWQVAVGFDGNVIEHIPLNDERVGYFLDHYDKDSVEYNCSFKKEYKKYLKEKEKLSKPKESDEIVLERLSKLMSESLVSEKSNEFNINLFSEFSKKRENFYLPILYFGKVPSSLSKEYDSEEYLSKVYNDLGIKIIDEDDSLFYRVEMPEGWKVVSEGFWNRVVDNEDVAVLRFGYEKNNCDRTAFVDWINSEKLEKLGKTKKINLKKDE